MEYILFEENVKDIVGDAHFHEHRQLLLDINTQFRSRCINTLALGFKIPETIRHLKIATKLPEKYYRRYISYFHSNRHMPGIAI